MRHQFVLGTRLAHFVPKTSGLCLFSENDNNASINRDPRNNHGTKFHERQKLARNSKK